MCMWDSYFVDAKKVASGGYFFSLALRRVQHRRNIGRCLSGGGKEGVLNTHISKLDTKLYSSIPKWSPTYIQAANLPGYLLRN